MNINLKKNESFASRHNSPTPEEIGKMLEVIGVGSVDELINQTVPEGIRLQKPLDLPEAKSEYQFLSSFRKKLSKNKLFKSYIGMGYYNTIIPNVILRNILENPGWYTAYTPYQAEIAQGRLEALINFQTMVMDLTGMEIANASLLDEGTAAAEAMTMFHGARKGAKKKVANRFFVDSKVFPQTLDILKTRAIPLGIELEIGNYQEVDLSAEDLYGVLVQFPDAEGNVRDYKDFITKAKENDVFVAVGADIMSLIMFTPPGEHGADVVFGSTQRFGVPMGFGGPHAAYFATTDQFKRLIPGRIIGVSVDKDGHSAYRMALQTREQHIKREKATSNICTAQVLLAVIAGMYAVYHGPEGLKRISSRIHGLTKALSRGLANLGFENENQQFFDTIKVALNDEEERIALKSIALGKELNFRYYDTLHVGISLDETTRLDDVNEILEVFAHVRGKENIFAEDTIEVKFPLGLQRTSAFLQHEVFNKFHAEHSMLRYMKRLENKDLSLVHSMISLGSCTMKLNATVEMIPITWPEIGNMHPFAPKDQTKGYMDMIDELTKWLSEITGFYDVSLQPNSGAQGEYAGLMVIRAYHESRGESHRNITLIPSSAHGTNPASAVMAGTKVVIVDCDEKGNISLEDLKEKADKYADDLFGLMVTYPSTHGVFEENIREICKTIHDKGGQVYMDGANMNAQVGLTSPAIIGADVCHLNLHKTFCIPHGGGGPGMGPIGVAEHLAPFLPGNAVVEHAGGEKAITGISSAPYGSASILAISYAYISLMGADGLTEATKTAILNANYIKARLEEHYPILYTGSKGRAAHEMIVECRQFKKFGVEVEDIAKRLMDYGFHAPTVSFPVPGTLMIEPTESEGLNELNRFCDAMIEIRNEISEIENGVADQENNVLKNAPHTLAQVTNDNWEMPYTRDKAAFPLEYVRERKFWPAVRRIDSAYGDRNLMCACIPTSEYAEESEEVVN
ncbi:aminomethyl-transferring glycine dehydrogenase [Marinigracilibium pacificum]|uniref:Glycine dehydrogenase (decarboxylating) n=1 Tax=Marinigracilibium pacificum TaxID=2729599 RepID=A0A848IR16_9BACT|nr:aminomethyl-transferring glycine dehydrogenase [Marinigracilibium pacificum]NMM46903.1 aminomethyl-transferring glycine dehydrogenase [Marinigracilibium pacificum]